MCLLITSSTVLLELSHLFNICYAPTVCSQRQWQKTNVVSEPIFIEGKWNEAKVFNGPSIPFNHFYWVLRMCLYRNGHHGYDHCVLALEDLKPASHGNSDSGTVCILWEKHENKVWSQQRMRCGHELLLRRTKDAYTNGMEIFCDHRGKMVISTCLSIITLNINGLNAPIKIHRVANWIKRQQKS